MTDRGGEARWQSVQPTQQISITVIDATAAGVVHMRGPHRRVAVVQYQLHGHRHRGV